MPDFSELLQGIVDFHWQYLVMYAIGGILIYLAIKKEYEPMLLLPIGFGSILVNLPLNTIWESEGQDGILKIFYEKGILTEIFPILIFIGIGAMVDFTPLFANPKMIFFGAAAQFGIFFTIIAAIFLGFDLEAAASIGIIGPQMDRLQSSSQANLLSNCLGRFRSPHIHIWHLFLLYNRQLSRRLLQKRTHDKNGI